MSTLDPRAQAMIDELHEQIDHANRLLQAVREVDDWCSNGPALYDPLADRYSVQLPGELVRRCHELADPPDRVEDPVA
jgi:hypothetical protein